MLKKSLVSLFLIVLVSIILVTSSSLVKAQSITSLNSEIISLRSRINRLESEVNSLSRSIASNRGVSPIPQRELPSSSINNPPAINDTVVGRSDPLFQRLANFVIELKEDIQNLDRRVSAIEKRQ